MNPITPEELYQKLMKLDSDLPNLALSLTGVCDNCDCGLKESMEDKTIDGCLSRIYQAKQADCEATLVTSFNYLNNHPAVVMAVNAPSSKVPYQPKADTHEKEEATVYVCAKEHK
ncbi:MAG: hypothetical protein HWE11_12380 [Gammaproteobacteria bacterium]|nr:hypothetical protein [Gammaproteobacteria bacterium]